MGSETTGIHSKETAPAHRNTPKRTRDRTAIGTIAVHKSNGDAGARNADKSFVWFYLFVRVSAV